MIVHSCGGHGNHSQNMAMAMSQTGCTWIASNVLRSRLKKDVQRDQTSVYTGAKLLSVL